MPNDNNVIPRPASETPLNSSSASTDIVSENTENVENSAVENENTSTATTDTNSDLNLSEGEILSFKHTKNVYSLFKGSKRVIIGTDSITDGVVVLPLTDEHLAGVKKIAGDVIQKNTNLSA